MKLETLRLRLLWESLKVVDEGGWDSVATQGTVISPSVVKVALKTAEKLIAGFNGYLKEKGLPPVRMGAPTGSSAYHDVDPEDKVYGDIDLQLVVPDLPELANKTTSQFQSFWTKLLNDYVVKNNLDYIHPESKLGHPIVKIGEGKWVQIDIMPHGESVAEWGRWRFTPEHNVKGLLMGKVYSTLDSIFNVSSQHMGVQYKVRDGVKQNFSTTTRNYELKTLSTDIKNFIRHIFDSEYQEITKRDPKTAKIDSKLLQNPGMSTPEIKISSLVNGIKGLAASFTLNSMYGKGDLAPYQTEEEFLQNFINVFVEKTMKDYNSSKREGMTTPEAQARADSDKKKILKGIELVKSMF